VPGNAHGFAGRGSRDERAKNGQLRALVELDEAHCACCHKMTVKPYGRSWPTKSFASIDKKKMKKAFG